MPKNLITSKEVDLVEEAILNLLSVGAIRECKPVKGQFLSNYFLIPKSNGSMRFVLNLKELNTFIATEHFKMEDVRTAIKLMTKNCFLGNIDLQDAYYMIPIHESHTKYLRFSWVGQLFEFVCLPFGLNIAPWIFTKVVKPIVSKLRSQGLMSVVYLDDWLCLGKSKEDCEQSLIKTKQLLETLGFMINSQKSKLIPQKRCKYLGFILNSESMSIELPENKKRGLLQLIKEVRSMEEISIRKFSQLIGTMNAACPAIQYGWCHVKSLERQRYLALLRSNGRYDVRMKLNPEILPDLDWWERGILSSENLIREMTFSKTIFSDASRTGWGAYCDNQVAYGSWSDSERRYHINYLELLAAFKGLLAFAAEESHAQILLRIDNTTAISYINRMGGVKYINLNEMAREIWQWCEVRGIWLTASYIPSRDNVEADQASRAEYIDTEWELAPWAFKEVVKAFGEVEIDLFASANNAKYSKYCSWHRDPQAQSIDAFTIPWLSPFYAFPPFALILKVLRKMITDQAWGVVVVPVWTAQPWYPLWLSLLDSDPIYFEPQDNLLISASREGRHPLATKMRLMAARLSARPTRGKI